MKHKALSFLLLLLFSLSACTDDPFDPIVYGSLNGVVLNEADLTVVPGALVSTLPISSSTLTNDSGAFVMELLVAGEAEIVVEKNGFSNGRETVIITEDGTTQVTILLREKTEVNTSPVQPFDEYPTNLSVDIELQETLSWSTEDPNSSDSIRYDVKMYSSIDSQFQIIATDISDDFLELENLVYNNTYFWQVIVKDGVNEPVNGPVWQFKTKAFPDNRILFCRQVNNIYQIFSGDDAGNEVQVTFSQNHSWRPRFNQTRTKIAFISFDGIEKHLYQMNPDGSNIQKITSAIPIESFDESYMTFCWSPNGASLVYMNYNKLYQIFPDGTGLDLLSEIAPNLSFSYVDWIDYGQSQIMVRTCASNKYDSDIYIMNQDGQLSDLILENAPGRTGGGSFSINGANILFTHDISGFQSTDGRQLDSRIQITNPSSGIINDLSIISKPLGTNDLDPRYSPNEAYIIFVNTSNDGQSVKNIYKMDFDGERELLFENAEMPDWR